ncbi:MAG: YdcF family protein [Clostridiales bacterium]|nr:YdcF family protein [Clostridiales bacterium]
MIFTIIIILIALTIGAINVYILQKGAKYFTTLDKIEGTYDCAIVPGAKVFENQISFMLQDRLNCAYTLFIGGHVKKILVSGDHGENDYDEANAMRNYLLDKGVPIEDIFMDHAGFDTYATMTRAKEIFQVESAVICTQKYHLYRASYIAQKKGIEIQAIPCDVYISVKLPYFKLREVAARVKAFWEVEISNPKPMLGDAIPISGDGRATEDGKS